MTATVIRGDARRLPLPDDSVDLIVTSPPYFALRSYQDGGEHYAGQIGSEATPAEFVDALLDCTREWMRVLKPSGSLFVNLGDSFSKGQRLDNDFTAEDAAWLAGVIDSDGSISIRADNSGRSHVTWTRVGQMRPEVVQRIGSLTGVGQVFQDSRGVWNWNAAAQQARWVLERIWPWLRIKQRQALAGVDLMTRKQLVAGKGTWNPLSDDEIRARERIRQAVLAWNRGEEFADYEPPVLPLPEIPTRPRWVPTKSLLGMPWRYALACVDHLGLIWRAEVIWSKPNGLPESVTDRVRRSHEVWLHFTLRPRYYAAVDEIREAASEPQRSTGRMENRGTRRVGVANDGFGLDGIRPREYNPLGKLPGSVREVPSQPLTVPAHLGVDHFAAFPVAWPLWIIRGWSPPGICTACGEGRRPTKGVDWSKVPHRIVEKRAHTPTEVAAWCAEFAEWCDLAGVTRRDLDEAAGTSDMGAWWASRLPRRAAVPTPEQWAKIRLRFNPPRGLDDLIHLTRPVPVADIEDGSGNVLTGRHNRKAKSMSFGDYGAITGYACACPEPDAPTRPAVVLDPFGGTGTTALAASVLGRHGITVDLSHDYSRLAQWRTTDPGERARALDKPKPEVEPEAQLDIFGALEGVS